MSKPRRQKTKSFKKTYRIICPGKTETAYFNSLKEDRYPGISISIEPKLGKADKYEDVFEDLRRDLSFKEPSPRCFFINDMDAIVVQSKLKQYLADKAKTIKASKGALTVIESMPCIEFWFLLHYRYTDKRFPTYNSLKPDLLKAIPQYAKTEEVSRIIYSILKDKIDKAMENAAKTMKKKESCEGDCSYTNMHELIKFLDEEHRSR